MRPDQKRHLWVRRRNWRSFTGIQRKRNARTVRRAPSALLAFVYRDMAEIERQNGCGGSPEPVGRADPPGTAGKRSLAGAPALDDERPPVGSAQA